MFFYWKGGNAGNLRCPPEASKWYLVLWKQIYQVEKKDLLVLFYFIIFFNASRPRPTLCSWTDLIQVWREHLVFVQFSFFFFCRGLWWDIAEENSYLFTWFVNSTVLFLYQHRIEDRKFPRFPFRSLPVASIRVCDYDLGITKFRMTTREESVLVSQRK